MGACPCHGRHSIPNTKNRARFHTKPNRPPSFFPRAYVTMLFAELASIIKVWIEFLLTTVGVVLYYCGLARLVIGLSPGSPRVLMYHACAGSRKRFHRGPIDQHNTQMPRGPNRFHSNPHYQVVPLDSLRSGSFPESAPVAITFDDGFRSVFEHALPLLKSRNLPATCYLVTDLIESPSLIWINELNWYLRRHRLIAKDIVARRLGINQHSSMGVFLRSVVDRYKPDVIAELLTELRKTLRPEFAASGWSDSMHLGRDEIAAMSQSVFTFGNHTASHAVLSRLAAPECREEIRRRDPFSKVCRERLIPWLIPSVDSMNRHARLPTSWVIRR